MEIYLDILIIENFIVDIFLLSITFQVMRVKVCTRKRIISALVGALYTVVMVFPNLRAFTLLPFQLTVAFFMIFISLRSYKIHMLLKGTGVYILSSLTLSGLCFGFSLWQNSYTFSGGVTIIKYSLKYLVIAIMILYVICERVISYFRERALITNFIYDIEVSIDNIKYIIRGFLDTGNELREPITNIPCILVEENFVTDYKEDETYYIPYSAIGYSGKLKGFKCDMVRIRREGEEWQEVDAIICPCSEVLSRDKEYNALLSRGVI
ncbi:sigma-E processing peptidase SpoIIGA [Clostridium paraputrificum]|uniref:sigma-E processing peptidase SpoIIGA n=1 Tax=Clostridium TaxID=1485 RepID=UPI003D357B9F